ncbi:MAG: hypothetical protein R3D33_17580 [Hyphomicrobiaceae bacterium]
MAIIVLFHSALGLRPAVHDFADAIRAAGHTVHVPDYYDGRISRRRRRVSPTATGWDGARSSG